MHAHVGSHALPLRRQLLLGAQERIRIPEDKMDYYKDLAEMYVGDDVSPDFYGWVFPKYDHVAVGARSLPRSACWFLSPVQSIVCPRSPSSACVAPPLALQAADGRDFCCSQSKLIGEAVAHTAGTGTVINKMGIKQYQQATRDRSKVRQAPQVLAVCSLSCHRGGAEAGSLLRKPCHAAGACGLRSARLAGAAVRAGGAVQQRHAAGCR